MNNMQAAGNDILRPEGSRDPYGAQQGRDNLHVAYDWLEANLGDGAVGGGRCVHARRLRRGAVAVLRRLGRGDRPDAAEARRLSRPAARSSDCRPSGRRGPPLPRPISRSARPTATKRRPASFPEQLIGLDHFAQPRSRGCGRRRSCRGDSGAPASNSGCAAHGGRHPRRGRAPTARAVPAARSATDAASRHGRNRAAIASSGSAKSLHAGGGSAPLAANARLDRSQPP